MTTQNEHTHIIQLVYPTDKDAPFLVVIHTFIFRKLPCGFPSFLVPVVYPLLAMQSLPSRW